MLSLIFKKVLPTDKQLMEQVFRLRYQVYTQESNFLNPDNYPDGLERDELDDQSVHFAAITEEGDVIGCVRMILPQPHKLPIHQFCKNLKLSEDLAPENRCAEISRLIISREWLRPKASLLKDFRPAVRRLIYQNSFRVDSITFRLSEELCRECKHRGVTHVFALMEKSLSGLVKKYGFDFKRIGNRVDFLGSVYPHLASTEQIDKAIMDYRFAYTKFVFKSSN